MQFHFNTKIHIQELIYIYYSRSDNIKICRGVWRWTRVVVVFKVDDVQTGEASPCSRCIALGALWRAPGRASGGGRRGRVYSLSTRQLQATLRATTRPCRPAATLKTACSTGLCVRRPDTPTALTTARKAASRKNSHSCSRRLRPIFA
jgi:hypothetical protein